MRGVVYRAFRGTFHLLPSMLLVVGVQTWFHWGLVSQDLVALFSLTIGGVALCLIREHTRSAWNCVLFHALYNAAMLRQWSLCVIGMIIALGWCACRPRPRTDA